MTSALSSGELACDDPCESTRPRLLGWQKMGHSSFFVCFFNVYILFVFSCCRCGPARLLSGWGADIYWRHTRTLALKPDPDASFIELHDITSHNTAWNIKPTEIRFYCVCEKIVAPQKLVHPSWLSVTTCWHLLLLSRVVLGNEEFWVDLAALQDFLPGIAEWLTIIETM